MSQPQFQEAYIIDATCTVSDMNKDEGNDTFYAGTKRNLADLYCLKGQCPFEIEKALHSLDRNCLKRLKRVEVVTKQDLDARLLRMEEELQELRGAVSQMD